MSGEAVLILAAEGHEPADDVEAIRVAEGEHRRRFASRLHRAADAYLVRRGSGKTVIAGYPWFTDWGRDTLIALRGLCLATGRFDDARAIILEWSGAVSEGMLPNRFPGHGAAPEFNAVDAAPGSWWPSTSSCRPCRTSSRDRDALEAAIDAIVSGCARGTRYGIRADDGGLPPPDSPASGSPGWTPGSEIVVTPRIASPSRQALWLNALHIAGGRSDRWSASAARGRESFPGAVLERSGRGVHDVVDVDHRAGTVDATIRPNQISPLSGLPFPHPRGPRARRASSTRSSRPAHPLGLPHAVPGGPGYTPHYRGGVAERDGAYHQGTAWPWLMGAFVEAWVRVRGGTANVRREARARFLDTLCGHLDDAGLGHLPEIADGDAPHTPRGCPFQAWSVGEALRLTRLLA